jgi:hypothetical protein
MAAPRIVYLDLAVKGIPSIQTFSVRASPSLFAIECSEAFTIIQKAG